jgi:type VI secretion system protein ImpC
MDPLGWRFVVLADLGMDSPGAVRLPSEGGVEAVAAALAPRPLPPLGPAPDATLHDPAVQRVESALRGLALLQVHAPGIRVDVVSCTQKDAPGRFREAVFDPEMKELRNPPLGLVVLDFDYSHQASDLAALSEIADMAKVAQAPVLASASPAFFGLKQLTLLPKLQDIPQRLMDGSHAAWQKFQKSEPARWTALTVNRWLQRNPHPGEACDPAKPETWLWGRGGWLLAAAAARSIAATGHALDLTGPRSGGFQGMATRPLPRAANASVPFTAEVEVPDALIQELTRGGFTPLVGRLNSDTLMIPMAVNAFRSAPGRLTVSGTLPYQILAGRLAQLCAFLMDAMPPGEAGLGFLKTELLAFLGPLAAKSPDTAVEVRPETVKDAEGASVRVAQVSILPEARLEGMEFRYTYQLPLKG